MAVAERNEIIDLSLESFYETITNFGAYPEFVSGMKSTKILESRPDGTQIVAFDIELIKRVQYTVAIKSQISEDKKQARVEWNLVQSDALKVSHGLWVLKSLGPQRTDVTYKLEVEFNFMVPGFVLKGLIATSMPLAIQEFKNRAQKKAGK
jgi:ribosome-associated toxin RatA of RatAB toxin-antitoxin module